MKLRVLAAVPLIASTALLAACGNGLLPGGSSAAGPAAAKDVTTAATGPKSSPSVMLYSGDSAAQIFRAAQRRDRGGTSVRVRGAFTEHGTTFHLDLTTDRAGRRQSGAFAFTGATGSFRKRGSTIWLKGNARYWELAGVPAGRAELVADRWITMPAHNPYAKPFLTLMSFKELASMDPATPAEIHRMRTVRGVTIAGRPTVGVYSPAAPAAHDSAVTMYFAATGSGLPVMVKIRGGSRLSFSDWNAPVHVSAPKNVMPLAG